MLYWEVVLVLGVGEMGCVAVRTAGGTELWLSR